MFCWICIFLATTFLLSRKLDVQENGVMSKMSSNGSIISDSWRNQTYYHVLESSSNQQRPQPLSNTKDKSDNDSSSFYDNLPYFVLHIGPQKTMSSAIQCSLQKLEANLTLDGYKFVGKCDARACYKNSPALPVPKSLLNPFYDEECIQAIVTASNLQDVKCWNDFVASLNESAAFTNSTTTIDSNHVILSDEKISEAQMKWWDVDKTIRLWKLLQTELSGRYQFHIVMVYRRYYEWLMSVKNQADKYSLGRRGMKLWNGPEKEAIYPNLLRWITNKTEIPSPYLPEMYDLYSNTINLDVSLLNMHDGSDLLETFLCHTLRQATHACQAYRDNPDHYKSNSNPSENHFYDMIAYDAYHQGLVRDLRDWKKGADRLFFTEMLGRRMKRQHKTPWDLPLTCPSKEDLRVFLDASKTFEKDLLPDFYQSSQGQSQLQSKFWKDVDSRKFCSVNTTAVLEQQVWKDWFHNLWDPRRGKKPDDWETSDYKITLQNFTKLK